MRSRKTYAVLGLGRYGTAVATELVENGCEVIAIDFDQKLVNDAAAYIPICKCADVTDPEVISRLDIGSIDTVIVCIASDLEASVMAVTLCKEAGVKNVIAKCANAMQQNESGIRLAKNLLSSGFIDMISLSKDVSMVELDVKSEWVGKNLIELNLRKKYGFNVVALKNGERVEVNIDPEKPLLSDDNLIVIANVSNLSKLR